MSKKFSLKIVPEFHVYDNAVVCYATAIPTNKTVNRLSSLNREYLDLCRTQFKGVARLKPGDERDVEMGKRIAYLKCKRQINNAWFSYLDEVATMAYKNFSTLIDMHSETAERLADIENKILKETE